LLSDLRKHKEGGFAQGAGSYMPWGINWLSHHKVMDRDLGHFAAMQYRSVVVYEDVWSSAEWSHKLAEALPNAIFLVRDHPLSEQKGDMYTKPRETGRRHAAEWAQKVKDGRVHVPLGRSYFLGINEPDSNWFQAQIDNYNEAFVRGLNEAGLKAAAYSFGVGHPSTVGLREDGAIDWSWYAKSAEAVLAGDNIVDFHAYGVPPGWSLDHHLARVAGCPWPFKVVFGEFGVDWGIVPNTKVDGWATKRTNPAENLTGEGYVEWVDRAQALILGEFARKQSKLEVLSFDIFSYDSNADWRTFDIMPIRDLFERRGEWIAPKASNQVHVPIVSKPAEAGLWEKVVKIVIDRFEGGLSLDPNDPGNWYNGELVGTKYGISGKTWGHLYDIRNLTRQEAESIYFKHYWQASGADKMAWPLCLLHFDSAVQFGSGVAAQLLRDSGGKPWKYMSDRLFRYTRDKNWRHFGAGWTNRMAMLMEYFD
jgi:hypothetical protein